MNSYKELQKLFIKIKQGDGQAFKELYESSYRAQYFIAFNYAKDQHLAEEAVQNMFINFYNHIDTINNSMGIIKWMNTTTINECKRLLKTEKNRNRVNIETYEDKLIDSNLNPEEMYKQEEERKLLNKALDKIDPKLKQILIYRYVDDLKVKEIAELTNQSIATVNRNINKGTKKLKELIEKYEKES